jgi:hypothetical protein
MRPSADGWVSLQKNPTRLAENRWTQGLVC